MAALQESEPPVFQQLKSAIKSAIRLPTRVCAETGQRYLLWSDVQETLEGTSHPLTSRGRLAHFMITSYGELHRPLRVPYDFNAMAIVCRVDFSGHQAQCNNSDPVLDVWSNFLNNRHASWKASI